MEIRNVPKQKSIKETDLITTTQNKKLAVYFAL